MHARLRVIYRFPQLILELNEAGVVFFGNLK